MSTTAVELPLHPLNYHESRHSTNHAENQQELTSPTENSPLLRFPESRSPRYTLTTFTVSILLLILIAGVIIGIYLLMLQNSSDNVLPPVELPLQLVSRSQWVQNDLSMTTQNFSPFRLKQVIVVHTNTHNCVSTETCIKLLQEMQANATASKSLMPYNFLISSNGQTYEVLGWRKLSPMFAQKSFKGLVLGFIGNFSEVPPTWLQIEEAKNFFAESISHQYLDVSYNITGKNDNDTPVYLRQSFQNFRQWNNEFIDPKNN